MVVAVERDGHAVAVPIPGRRIAAARSRGQDHIWDRGQEEIVGGSYDVVGVWAEGSGRFERLDTFTSDTAVLIWETDLDRGYQRMMGAVNWCGITNHQPDAPPFLLPADDRATNLYVGPTWDALQAWSCEW